MNCILSGENWYTDDSLIRFVTYDNMQRKWQRESGIESTILSVRVSRCITFQVYKDISEISYLARWLTPVITSILGSIELFRSITSRFYPDKLIHTFPKNGLWIEYYTTDTHEPISKHSVHRNPWKHILDEYNSSDTTIIVNCFHLNPLEYRYNVSVFYVKGDNLNTI